MATAKVSDKLDQIEENIMFGLKDFQRATVMRIAELYRSGQKRVLVSDEVGLGKTIEAMAIIKGMLDKQPKLKA